MYEKQHSASKSVDKSGSKLCTPRPNIQSTYSSKCSGNRLSQSRLSARSEQSLDQNQDRSKTYNSDIPWSSTPYSEHGVLSRNPKTIAQNSTSVSPSFSARFNSLPTHSPVLGVSPLSERSPVSMNLLDKKVEKPPNVPKLMCTQTRSHSFTPRRTMPLPTFNIERAEHIYEEISDLDLDRRNSNINQFRSDSQIRHLSGSPDFVRQSRRQKLTPKSENEIHSSTNSLTVGNVSVSEHRGTPRHPIISRLNPIKVHGRDSNPPSPAFSSMDKIDSKSSKRPASGTPKNLVNRLVSRLKRTPKKSKFARSLKFDENQF